MCTQLCNYALREQENVLFVELDIGQGNITIPGSLAATKIDLPITVTVCGGMDKANLELEVTEWRVLFVLFVQCTFPDSQL
jgi:polynucleotide 5'-kinase involved in rRNA processing